MRRVVVLAFLLALPALSGCLSAFKDKEHHDPVEPADIGYDPASIRVTGFVKHTATVASFDGTNLAVVAYEPQTSDLAPDGTAPRWGTVLFLHGWGVFKESYEGVGGATGAPIPDLPGVPYGSNRLAAFANAGLLAVAYDMRGFGQSDGTASIGGPAELADLEAVRSWAAGAFPTNGRFGLVGESYGGGQALLAWAENPAVTTAVPIYGWYDLYDGLLPSNVPKAEWAALETALGVAGSRARVSPLLVGWEQKGILRQDLGTVEAEMDARSAAGRLSTVTKPLFACQGLQESLFPQVDQMWQEAGGFTRAFVYTGGHATDDDGCWERALAWNQFFLGGVDTGVAGWPALTSVDADGSGPVEYRDFPVGVPQASFLAPGETPQLQGTPSTASFTVSQQVLNNPLQEPSAVWDLVGQPFNALPEQLRTDPTATSFAGPPFEGGAVLVGAPTLKLVLADPAPALPFQVAAQIQHVDAGGSSRILTRAAYAAIDADDLQDGAVTLRFHWVKADIAAGDHLVLKVGGNDASWYLPILANYSVDFTGGSELHVPYFEG